MPRPSLPHFADALATVSQGNRTGGDNPSAGDTPCRCCLEVNEVLESRSGRNSRAAAEEQEKKQATIYLPMSVSSGRPALADANADGDTSMDNGSQRGMEKLAASEAEHQRHDKSHKPRQWHKQKQMQRQKSTQEGRPASKGKPVLFLIVFAASFIITIRVVYTTLQLSVDDSSNISAGFEPPLDDPKSPIAMLSSVDNSTATSAQTVQSAQSIHARIEPVAIKPTTKSTTTKPLAATSKTVAELMKCGVHKTEPFFNISAFRLEGPIAAPGITQYRPLRVAFGTALPMQGESIHVMYDGIKMSNFMEMVQMCNLVTKNWINTTEEPTTRKRAKPIIHKHRDHPNNCTVHAETHVELWVLDVIRARSQKVFANNTFLQQLWFDGVDSPWKLLLVDYSDRFYAGNFYNKILVHDNITDRSIQQGIQDKAHIRTATRMIIRHRSYDEKKKRLNLGYVEMPTNANTLGGPTKHTSYTVRTDHVQQIKQILSSRVSAVGETQSLQDLFHGTDDPAAHWNAIYNGRQIRADVCLPPPYSLIRDAVDVAHFWPMTKSAYGHYRNAVTIVVKRLQGAVLPGKGTKIQTITAVSGAPGRQGRNEASSAYAEATLSAKIVIVTGRDNWEDHYRLMEALSAGAMVLSDVMLSLPKGLQNGTSLVFFRDLQELPRHIEYYLEHDEERQDIAKRGWEVSMGYHRAHHRMEELIFGCPLTQVNVPYEEMCPEATNAER